MQTIRTAAGQKSLRGYDREYIKRVASNPWLVHTEHIARWLLALALALRPSPPTRVISISIIKWGRINGGQLLCGRRSRPGLSRRASFSLSEASQTMGRAHVWAVIFFIDNKSKAQGPVAARFFLRSALFFRHHRTGCAAPEIWLGDGKVRKTCGIRAFVGIRARLRSRPLRILGFAFAYSLTGHEENCVCTYSENEAVARIFVGRRFAVQ